jgi:5-methyltetrahydrofolate corrinoid/iron sulfur protein methyltransferase
MFIIGELINGMYRGIARAVKERDAQEIKKCALAQAAAGADALDVNCGPESRNPVDDIRWMVTEIQSVTDLPLAIDSGKFEVIQAGLSVLKRPGIVNSTTADQEKLAVLIPLALRHGASLIGIAISSAGIPQNKDQRVECAARIVSACTEAGFPIDKLYLDPILMPVNVSQAQIPGILDAVREFKLLSDPAPRTIVGLSNISQGARERSIINRTFLSMGIAAGLDAAILDPCDSPLMDELITAEVILNKQIYCASFLQAYRKKQR